MLTASEKFSGVTLLLLEVWAAHIRDLGKIHEPFLSSTCVQKVAGNKWIFELCSHIG